MRPIPLPTNPGASGLALRTWAYSLEPHNAFFMYCDRSLRPSPHLQSEKEYHTHPGPVSPYDATPPRAFFSRISPNDVSRTEREVVRAQR